MEAILPAKRPRRIGLLIGLVLSMLLGTAGVGAATIRYDERHQDRLLPGVTVGGVDVGGMSFRSAQSLLESKFDVPLDRQMKVEVGGQVFDITPRALGVTSDWRERFAESVSVHGRISLLSRLWTRLTGTILNQNIQVSSSVKGDALEKFVNAVAGSADRPAKDASAKLVDGSLQIVPEANGFAVDKAVALKDLRRAAIRGDARVQLNGQTVTPKVPTANFRTVLVVKVGENKLYHYRDGQVVKVYDVATGKSNEPTPKGNFRIVRKRINPTWFNPAKTTWGRNMPDKILPGPRNPLGSRVLDMNGTLARIHATFRLYSIGYNDSQGCIRMRTADIEELFPQVEVGTPVLIVQAGSNRAVPRSRRPADADSQPSAENDGGSASPPQQAPPQEAPPSQPNPVPIPGG
jgi:lipoprotein-anchoring transpeptidase ErfK/SrfK